MFDIGFPELILLCIVALLVLGPERMPEAVRGLGLWLGRLRRNFTRIKNEIEREVGMDDIRRQLHNESILEEIRRLERDVKQPVPGIGNTTPRAGDAPGVDAASSAVGLGGADTEGDERDVGEAGDKGEGGGRVAAARADARGADAAAGDARERPATGSADAQPLDEPAPHEPRRTQER